MATLKFNTVNLLRERGEVVPANVPEDALIFSAPRPLCGTTTWEGDWVCGIFFAAVTADDPYRAMWLKENKNLDATKVNFVSDEQGRFMVREFYGEDMAEITYAEFDEYWASTFTDQFGRGSEEIDG